MTQETTAKTQIARYFGKLRTRQNYRNYYRILRMTLEKCQKSNIRTNKKEIREAEGWDEVEEHTTLVYKLYQ